MVRASATPGSENDPSIFGSEEDSLLSSDLDMFYSSRRSGFSDQGSCKSLTESSGIRLKSPSQRDNADSSSLPLHEMNHTSPAISNDKPRKRSSIDSSASQIDIDVALSLWSSISPSDSQNGVLNSGIDHSRMVALPAMNDTPPSHPRQRSSRDNASSNQNGASVGPQPAVCDTSASPQEIYVALSSLQNDYGYEYLLSSENHGCSSSVVSELSSPVRESDRRRSQKHRRSYSPTPTSMLVQQSLILRRHGTERSLAMASQTSSDFHSQDSSRSIMSGRSHLSLALKVQNLLELAADVVNSNALEHAAKCYQKAIRAAGAEITNINVQMRKLQGDVNPASKAIRTGNNEDLRLIGIIIGVLRTKMAILHGEDGEYARAINFCKGAVQVHNHQPSLTTATRNLEDTDILAGLMVLIIERLECAQTCFENHKKILDKIDLYSTAPKGSGSESALSSSKEIVHDMLERLARDDGSDVTNYDEDALELLSVHGAEQDKRDEGLKFLGDALQIHLVALGMRQSRAGESLLRVAKMYRGTGNDRKNEELVLGYFHQTAAVLKRSNLGQRARVSMLNDIAVIHMRRRDFEEAIKFLLDALHAHEKVLEDKREIGGRHIATLKVWRNLGESYMHREKFRSAERAFLNVLDIQRDCRKMQETAVKLDLHVIGVEQSLLKLASDISVADTICRLGKARAGSGDHKGALGIYRESLIVLNFNIALTESCRGRELLVKRDQLTHILYCIAAAESANEDYDKAQRMYELSLKLRNSTGAKRKDKRTATKVHCLLCFVGIGDVFMKQNEFLKAKKLYKNALTYSVAQQLKETHPVVVSIRKKLQNAEQATKSVASTKSSHEARLEMKADDEIERGALDIAIETLKELLIIRRESLQRLKNDGIDTSKQVYAIACLLQTFGFVFAKNGDDENAERAFKDASRLFRKGGQTGPTRVAL